MKAVRIQAGPGAPSFDLTHMETIDITVLVEDLTTSDVIWTFYPDSTQTLVKGEALLRKVATTGRPIQVRMLSLRVANMTQAETVAAALRSIRKRQMKGQEIETFANMLASGQEAYDYGFR
jgi:hypothetical protein